MSRKNKNIVTPEVETPEVETPEVETLEVETPEVETPEVETPTPENMINAIFTGVNALANPVKTEMLAGIESNVYSYVTSIEKDGKTELVTRTIRNAVAVKAMSLLDKLVYLETQSAKLTVLAMSKLTKAHAESIGKKTVKELILDRFPNYDGNTIDGYRRVGLLFANDRKNADDFTFCDGIPQDTSVTNLVAMIRVLELSKRKDKDGKQISLEKLSDKELAGLRDEILHYIILDRLHPLATLKTLRVEIDNILKDKHAIDNNTLNTDGNETDGNETDGNETDGNETDNESNKELETLAQKIERATHAINTLIEIFKDNETVKNATLAIVEEINKMTSETK